MKNESLRENIIVLTQSILIQRWQQTASQAMFTLYRIGSCSVSKVAPIQCEQELMFCSGAEIVSKRS